MLFDGEADVVFAGWGNESLGRDVVLTRGRLSLKCRFDPKTGLPSTQARGKTVLRKPSPELVATLQKFDRHKKR